MEKQKSKANRKSKVRQSHLEWLVENRSKIQKTSLELFQMMQANLATFKNDRDLGEIPIGLGAVSFSLWRAVFLADRSDSFESTFNHALAFLETVIGDNTIGYSHDKNAREWTFNYYMNNARFRLLGISEFPENILPNFDPQDHLGPREQWEHYHKSLCTALKNCSKLVRSP